jgi:hypothetical protein
MRRFLVMLAALVLMAPAAPQAPRKAACAACCHHQEAMRAADLQTPACCRVAPDPPRFPARPVDTRQAADGVGPRVIDALSPVDTSRAIAAPPRLSDRGIRHMRLLVIRI